MGGDVPDGRWGGQLLANLVRTDGSERRFEGRIESPDIRFHTDRPDLDLGESRVQLTSEGHYRLRARVPAADGRGDSLILELTLTPDPHRYLPPVDVSPGGFTSGYVVPALGGLAEGRVCLEATCDSLVEAPAYHDHNWGVWRDVTWDWGVARAGDLSLIYGGVRRADATTGGRFLFAVDSLGLKGVLPVRSLEYVWQAGDGSDAPPDGPDGFRLLAHQGRDTVSLAVDVDHVRVTPREADAARFFQMRGIVEVRGTLLGKTVSEEGAGFFETWTTGGERLARAIESRLAETGAEFAVAYRDLESGEEILLRPDLEFHAASMMKVPVMVRLYRMAESGQLSLDASVRVGNVFTSILDGSEYSLSPEDDSDSTLYRRIGSDATVRELLDRMITRSSNLATNLLIEIADPDSIAVLLESVGAGGMRVLRGVEDIPAYRAGMNNTTTARGLLELYTALGRGEVAGPVATEEMIDILSEQEFNDAIPAGLPPGIPVAHKTGWITGVDHDGGIVLPPGEPPYVLVILTRGVEDEGVTRQAAADVSRMIWEHRQEGAGGD